VYTSDVFFSGTIVILGTRRRIIKLLQTNDHQSKHLFGENRRIAEQHPHFTSVKFFAACGSEPLLARQGDLQL
jgi:hypothetical protein